MSSYRNWIKRKNNRCWPAEQPGHKTTPDEAGASFCSMILAATLPNQASIVCETFDPMPGRSSAIKEENRRELLECAGGMEFAQVRSLGGNAMNWDQIAGQWKQFKGKAKVQWGKLTDDEIDIAAGKRDQLVGKIQQKYGITKEDAERQVDQWAREL
jgi:uncharacterized protein YjbJ (UPF0337 family)